MIRLLGIGVVFSVFFLVQRILYQRFWLQHLTAQVRFVQDHIIEGEQGELNEILVNKKILPLPMLKVKFRTDRHLIFQDIRGSRTTDQFYRNDIFRVGGGEKVTRTLSFTGGRRGYYTIDGVSLVSSDLFLTAQLTAEQPLQTSIYVYPRPYDSSELQKTFTWLNGEILARRHLLEDPFEYRGIREYQPYDQMRSINWKASAKTGGLMVNQKNFTALKSVRIFLNIQDDNVLKKEESVEMSLRIAAGLCAAFLSQGIQVSCRGNGMDLFTNKPLSVAARAGEGQLDAVCRALTRIDLKKPVADFVKTFEEDLFSGAQDTLTCFVSPNQYDDFTGLLEKYQEAGNTFVWIYPVQGSKDPVLPPSLADRIRLIHFQV